MVSYSPPRYLLRRHNILKNVRGGAHFIEVGAGNLKLSSELSKHFQKGTCLDFAPKVKDIHKTLPKHIQDKLSVVIDDFFTADLPKKVDCIVSCEVMEHIKEDKKLLNRINELLNKDGQVILSVPAKMKYWTVHDEVVGHVKRYEKKELHKLMEAADFKDVRVISYGFPFINMLWLMRKAHGYLQAGKKKNWTQEKQTKESGVGQLSSLFTPLGIIANKYVFYPLNLIASLFNNFDLSEGYLILATKR
jgi:SAM-dependent methyltransferase